MKNLLLTSLILLLLSSCTLLSQPTLSEDEVLFQEIARSGGQFTSDGSNCDEILKTESWCSVVLAVNQVTRPEWTSLFPNTTFFLVKRNVRDQEKGFQRNWLIAKQGDERFTIETFGSLLDANNIVSTDAVREQIVKAFVLMSLPDYMDDEIRFSNWGQTNQRSIIPINYNYTITVWTKIQGLRFRWSFIFYEDKFIAAAANPPEYHVGEYIDIPFDVLPIPSSNSFDYWNKE
jgi:hypothetical protein